MKNKENQINLDEDKDISDSDSSERDSIDSFDVDYERLTLIDVKKRINEKRLKRNKDTSLLNKKRKNPNSFITFDSSTKTIKNTFCPSIEELNEFLENCKVQEININDENDEAFHNNDQGLFNPREFMKKNKIEKSYLSISDLQNINIKELNEKQEKTMELIVPKMANVDKDVSSMQPEKEKIEKIINNEIMDSSQRLWLNNHIKEIIDMPLSSVIYKGKKLEIIFDLDNTLIFSFIKSFSKEEIKYMIENNKEKKMYFFSFKSKNQFIYSAFIIREGVQEFINFTKQFCNFHIRTLAQKPYARKVVEILEKNFGIKFNKIIMRDGRIKYERNVKSIGEFGNKNINNNNTIIFDDSVLVWEKDLSNVIPSKKFFDKLFGISCIEQNKEKINNFTEILKSHGRFYYHSFSKKELNIKNQSTTKISECPFYLFKQQGDKYYYDIYNGEYFGSDKKQFIFMKNVVKVIYYFVYHDNVPIYEAIKLIRFNALYGKFFYLKYVINSRKKILCDIIKVCGGEIIEPDDDSINFKMKKIFLVCSMSKYENERNNIINEVSNNNNYILINEKFILDCYYFMTDLGNDCSNDEYNPESCLKFTNLFFK